MAGLAMATVLATIVVVVADRTFLRSGRRTPLGPFAKAVIVWAAVFFTLALIIGSASNGGAGFLVIPFLAATIAAGGVELARRAAGRS